MNATLHDTTIRLAIPYDDRQLAKGIPGYRWDKPTLSWHFPASRLTARRIVEAVGAEQCDASIVALATTTVTFPAIPYPETLLPPWDHQREAYARVDVLSGFGFWGDMGTGKTKVPCDWFAASEHQTALVLGPLAALHVWARDMAKHVPAEVRPDVLILDKGSTHKRSKLLTQALDVARIQERKLMVCVNYQAARMGRLATVIEAAAFPVMVFDEIQICKSGTGAIARWVAKISKKAHKRIGLSGTPLPHSRMDAYGIYRCLDESIFGWSKTAYRNRYAVMGGYGNHEVKGWQRDEEWREYFGSISFRVDAKDVLDLPPFMDEVIRVTLEKEAQGIYDALNEELIADVGKGVVTASNALVRLLRLQQVTSGTLPVEEDDDIRDRTISTAKREALAGILDGLPIDEPVVVFGQFHCDLDTVHAAADAMGRQSLELSGRRKELFQWQGGEAPVLAVQIQAGGVGIDLTRARICVYLSTGFNMGSVLQSRARVHRPGQTRPVVYYHIIAAGTVDEAVRGALARREADVVGGILDRMRDGSAESRNF